MTQARVEVTATKYLHVGDACKDPCDLYELVIMPGHVGSTWQMQDFTLHSLLHR